MALTLNNGIFTGFEVVDMKKRDGEDSEASTCDDDVCLDTFDFLRQVSGRTEVSTRFNSEDLDSPTAAAGKEWTAGLTKKQVLAMGAELLQGFSAPGFQEELQKLVRNRKPSGDVPGRMELALTVQRKVLPKYGLPGTFEGVEMMLDAVSPFIDDYMVQQMHWAIDEKLGMKAETPSPASDGDLGKVHYLTMAQELLDGYSTADFQQKLQVLLDNRKSTTDVPGRMDLALTVQSKVLPKYGFPGTLEGVLKMLDAISPFVDDDKMQELLLEIDEKLGMCA